MRLVYLGTPSAAVPPLTALVEAGHRVDLVVTRPDRRRGRGGATSPSPVKAAAAELGLPVSHQVDDVLATGAELGVVVAFGQLIKPHVLDAVPMVNVHFSLLPRWRGAAPVERAILAGDAETGVCVMTLEAGLDTGPVHARRSTPIDPDESAEQLRSRLVDVGTELLLAQLQSGLDPPVPQQGEPTYAAKIDPSELRLDFSQPAELELRKVRVGRAWTTFRGRRLGVLAAAIAAEPALEAGAADELGSLHPAGDLGVHVRCGSGTLLTLVQVQPEGKRPQAARDWANGARPQPGDLLGR